MSWDVVMFGSLSVPERNLETWLTTPVSPELFPWLDELPGDEVEATPKTPEALLARLGAVVVEPHDLYAVSLDGSRLEVACRTGEDPYRETCQALALLVASAAEFDGWGELTFLGSKSIQFGERVTVVRGQAFLTVLSKVEQAVAARARSLKALEARHQAHVDALVGRPAGSKKGRTPPGADPFTGREAGAAR
jgi:hypothetical protein